MTGIRFVSLVVLAAAGGCTVGSTPPPAYPQQMAWTGPPGGAIDPGYGYAYEEGGGSYEGSYPPDGDDPAAANEPSADPVDPNYAFGNVTDVEIETTLEASGEWVEDEDYGRVWLPYTTVVGADFTPYDSSGSWLYTDYGWAFQSDFDWGWLAFHFGRWALFDDDRWGWVPDYTWGSSWCDWRHDQSGGIVGWRPLPPAPRDHRGTGFGGRGTSSGGHAIIRDHRTHGSHKEPSWRFARAAELSRRSRSFSISQAEGLRATSPVVRPPAGQLGGRAASLMGPRLRGRAWLQTHPTRATVGTRNLGQSTAGGRPWMKPRDAWNDGASRGPRSVPPQASRNDWRGNGRDWRPTQGDWRPQSRPQMEDGRGRTFGVRPEASGGSRMWPQRGDLHQGAIDPRANDAGEPSGSRGWGDRAPSPSRPSFDSTGSRGDRSPPSSRPSFDSSGSRGWGDRSPSPSRPSFDSSGSRGDRSPPPSRPSFGGGSRPTPAFGGGSRPSFSPSGGSRSSPSFGGGGGGSRPSFSPSGGSRSAPSASSSSSGGSRGSSSSSSSSSSRSSSPSSGGGRRR